MSLEILFVVAADLAVTSKVSSFGRPTTNKWQLWWKVVDGLNKNRGLIERTTRMEFSIRQDTQTHTYLKNGI